MRPVNRIKHVVDLQSATVAGTQVNSLLIDTVDAPVLGNTDEVQTGSTINGIYLKYEATPTSSAALPNFYLIIWKDPGGAFPAPTPNTVGSNDLKKYVIHQEMVMLQQTDTGNPRVVFNGVVAIPKHYRRFGPGDQLFVSVLSPGINTFTCFQCHYKEFR